ncbi:hypothetical protein [Vacuolonema iberomarrocanum]|uniref:hypothetical protein n=1 Tax=Vacuolonema iberomarrocanum TaxID=3454632 RepID=UPI0019F55398|nr:hypothetical protein [filamentous cyanobacterium LEGE 07170]
MASKKSKKRLFSGMGYRDVQRSNANRRRKLPRAEQKWLKENGYRNVGWDPVIRLYQKINDLLSAADADDPTLEVLFLQAESIGNKYQTTEEREAFNQALSVEVEAISEKIDQQFPDNEVEFIDFSQVSPASSSQRRRGKTTKKRK